MSFILGTAAVFCFCLFLFLRAGDAFLLGRSGISGVGNGLWDYYVAKTLASPTFRQND